MTFAQPFSDYEILDRVGAGAMGTVFKARHKRLNRIVALKVLKPSLARDTRYVDRLRREARIVASLSHPYIVTGYDLGEEGGYHFFVMEFVEGKSLRGLMTEWGMIAEEYVLRVARQVAMALDHAFARGVIHRDIKPGNILIDEADNVKLTDMGLAKGPADLTITRDGATVGTPQYISPEQARNPHDVDVRTDLWSLGATLYHMAVGVPPFRGDTMAELITNVLNQPPIPPNEINPALSDGLSLVIRKLLAKDLTVRYQTPRELLDDLDRIDKAQPPQVDEARLVARGEPIRWGPRVAVGAVVSVLLGVAWWIGMQMRDAPLPEPTAQQYLQQLDAELAALDSPGARLARLDAQTKRPLGSEVEFAQRRRVVVEQLQQAVDGVVTQLLGSDWPHVLAWMRKPDAWPDRARVMREHVQARLLAASGIAVDHLPGNLRARIEELEKAIDAALVTRDAELSTRFARYLATTLTVAFDRRLRAGDFAGAQVTLNDALKTFGDGVVAPLPEQLPKPLLLQLLDQVKQHQEAVLGQLGRAEDQLVQLMLAEATDVLQGFAESLAADSKTPPEVVATRLQRYRRECSEVWPGTSRFRVGHDPWPELERRFAALQQRILLAIEAADATRFQGRCDLAWRTVLRGRARDAMLLLQNEAPPNSPRGVVAAQHQAAMAALVALETALLDAVKSASKPPMVFLRVGDGEPLELSVAGAGETRHLVGQSVGKPTRPVQLAELRARELIEALGPGVLAAVPPQQRPLAEVLVRLLGDDLVGLGAYVTTLHADQRFLLDEVWPRIERLRNERSEISVDRADVFARLSRLRDAVLAAGDMRELDTALKQLESGIRACATRASEGDRSPREAQDLREAELMRQLGHRRRSWVTDIVATAPTDAAVAVHIDGDRLRARVVLSPAALDGKEGWQLQADRIEFGGGDAPWSQHEKFALRASTGLGADLLHARLVLDFSVPPANDRRRFYLMEFRGVAVVIVFAGDDSVHAALVDGDPRRESAVNEAFLRAIAEVSGKPQQQALPGAQHRLTIDVQGTSGRRGAAVRVAFEGREIETGYRELDAQPPNFVLYPQQEIAVMRVMVESGGS